jgi:hypothetical protein
LEQVRIRQQSYRFVPALGVHDLFELKVEGELPNEECTINLQLS